MTGWLASITDIDDARQVLAAGANIIDAKNPHAGALGALPVQVGEPGAQVAVVDERPVGRPPPGQKGGQVRQVPGVGAAGVVGGVPLQPQVVGPRLDRRRQPRRRLSVSLTHA